MTSIRPAHDVAPVPDNHLRAVLAMPQFNVTEGVAVVGIKGYVKQFTGAVSGGNLTGVYDDAICIVTPQRCLTFLGNTDPSRLIVDEKTGLGRAVLEPGFKYRYQRGIHGLSFPKEKQYPAWVQAGPVLFRRVQEGGALGPLLKPQYIGCNIHKGGVTMTNSAACQTIVPEKWDAFDSTLEAALKAAAQSQFWYVLTT